MNKFLVFPCVEQNSSEGYQGDVISLVNKHNVAFILFFPIGKDYANLVNYLLKPNDSANEHNMQLLSVYKTMIDSWNAGNKFLSGIIMDVKVDQKNNEETIAPYLLLSDSSGNVDAFVSARFVDAITIASMLKKEIIVTSELLNKLVPLDGDQGMEMEETGDKNTDEKSPPLDKKILDIAKNIMEGNIVQDNKEEKEEKEEDPKSTNKKEKRTTIKKTTTKKTKNTKNKRS